MIRSNILEFKPVFHIRQKFYSHTAIIYKPIFTMAGQESVTLDSIERLLNNKLNTRGRGSGRPWKNRGHGGFNRGKGSFRGHPYNNFAQSNDQGKRLL